MTLSESANYLDRQQRENDRRERAECQRDGSGDW